MNTVQSLLDIKNIYCSGSFVEDFVENSPHACHLRDSYSEKYLIANHQMISFCGLKSIDDIIGTTRDELWIQDIANRRLNLNLDPIIISYEEIGTKFSKEIEKKIQIDKHPRTSNVCSLDSNGIIKFDNIIKFPILDHKKIIIAFLSVFIEKTNQLHLYKLFQHYQNIYPKQKSIQKILQHLNIDIYFNHLSLPTFTELEILFEMRNDSRHKVIAKKLECSVPTISNHISHIEDKLSSQFTIHDIISKLRAIPINEQSRYQSY